MKKFLFVQTQPPHGSINGQEGLDAVLMGSAFTECAVLFLDDGIYQILSDQQTGPLNSKDYSVTYLALADYGVNNIYCCQTHLNERSLSTKDLILPVQALPEASIRRLFDEYDVILSF